MHVLIIGGGVAGLTCARLLDRAGIFTTLVEAADGIGGRVRSDDLDGYILDRGFQVLFDAYPAARRQLNLAALNLRPFDPGAIICLNGRRAVLTDPLRDRDPAALLEAGLTPVVGVLDKFRVLQLALTLRAQSIDDVLAGPDQSSLSYLRDLGFSVRIIDRFFRPFYGGILFDRELETSAKCLRFDFKMLAEGQTAVPAGGMRKIAEQLASPLCERGRVRLRAPVAALLEEEGRCVGARLESGETIHADTVVVATAAPEAARLTRLAMPEGKRQTVTLYYAGERPITSSRKIFLNANQDAFVNNAQVVSNVAPSYAPPGKHLLSASVIGMPEMDDDALFRLALRDMHRMFDGDVHAQAALASYQPLRLYRISYAQFPQPPGFHPRLPANRTERPGLFVAGEFTEASSINAAMISGEQCAAAILAEHRPA